jgi:galactose mutarotase-like enzyme
MDGRVRLEADGLSVECVPGAGFTITSIHDSASGAEALWKRAAFEPAAFTRDVGPSGEASNETFVDRFIGGWFEMFPSTGYSGTMPGPTAPTRSLLHGEVRRLPWTLTHQDARSIEATVDTIRTPFRLTRRLEIAAGELLVHERVENRGPIPMPYTWGHHPNFSRATFAGGRIELDVASAEVPEPIFDVAHNTLAGGRAFTYPNAPTTAGGVRDVAALPPDADGRHEQVTLVMRSGALRLTAPKVGRAFALQWDVADFPYVLIWQDYLAPGAAFWGTADTFAVEPQTCPGRSFDDAVRAGAGSYLAPGEQREVTLRAGWGAL